MASKIIVDQLESSGSNITIPTGTGLVVTDGIAATNLSGTIADARLPTVPVSKGGTGLTSLGSAGQGLKVNSGGNALEFGSVGADFSPMFRAYLSSNQGISGSSTTRVAFANESYDTDNAFNTSTNTFTVPSGKGGKYYIYAQVRKDNFSGTRNEMAIKIVNGAELMIAELGNLPDSYSTMFTSGVIALTAGQEVEVVFFHNDSGTRNINAADKSTFFGAYKLTD